MAAQKAKKRTRDQSLGASSKRVDKKTTPPAKKVTEGASKVANKNLSYALAAAQRSSQPSPFCVIITGPAGGLDYLPKETFDVLIQFVVGQWMVLKPKATSRSSNWSKGRGYIHACDQQSQEWYISTLNKSKEKGFKAFKKEEFNMPSCKVKVPAGLCGVKPETLLQTAMDTAEIKGKFWVRASHKVQDGGTVLRLQLEHSLVKSIDRNGGILYAGCDVLRFEFLKPSGEVQPVDGVEGQVGDPSGPQ